MKSKIILIFCIFSAVSCLRADFVEDFQAAQDLYIKRRFDKAAEAFTKIVKSEKKAVRKDKALLYVARCLGKQSKKNYEQALKTVQQISSPQLRTFAEIELMFNSRKYPDMLNRFSKNDLDTLGDNYTYLACYYRGHAFFKSRKYDLAKKDLEKAADASGSDQDTAILAYYDLAQVQLELKEPQQALKIIETLAAKMSDSKNNNAYQRCVLLGAEIVSREKKYTEAKEFLDRYSDKDSKRTRGYSRFCLYAMYGDIETALGNQAQAKDWYLRAVSAGNYGKETQQVKAKLEKLK